MRLELWLDILFRVTSPFIRQNCPASNRLSSLGSAWSNPPWRKFDVRWICSALKQRCFRFSNLNLLLEALILEILSHISICIMSSSNDFAHRWASWAGHQREDVAKHSKTMCHHAVHRPSFTKKRSFPSWNLLLDFFMG